MTMPDEQVSSRPTSDTCATFSASVVRRLRARRLGGGDEDRHVRHGCVYVN
jgi:hypothetical protein